jgi:transposase-like protein
MDHRIREALKQGKGKLFGTVEVDETYIGGKHLRKDGFRKKAAVMGMIERGGRVKAFHIPARETHIILNHIRKNVHPLAKIMSDEAHVYSKLPRFGYQHASIKHGKWHWKRGDVSTNTIESFWALFKRGTIGTHHAISKKHLQRYIDEYIFRFNRRELLKQEMFEDVVERVSKRGKISYKLLTA